MIFNIFSAPNKKEKDYGSLWKSFINSQKNPELKDWKKKVYVPGQYQPVQTKPDNLQAEVISEEIFNNQ